MLLSCSNPSLSVLFCALAFALKEFCGPKRTRLKNDILVGCRGYDGHVV